MPGPLDREKYFLERKLRGEEAVEEVKPSRAIPGPGADKGVRYVVKRGVTHAVPLDERSKLREPAAPVEAPEPVVPTRPTFKIAPPPPRRAEEVVAPELPDAHPDSVVDAALLWESLPRHVQILASLTHAAGEPSGERTFEETRPQLLSRLLDPTLTLEETAKVLDVCPATIRRYTNRGSLPHTRTVGQQRRFRLSEVLKFLEMRADRAAEEA